MSFLVGQNIEDVAADTFNGDNSTTGFTLSAAAVTNAAHVFLSGVRQTPTTDYSISGTTLTFTTAPATGTANILVVYAKPSIVNVPADDSVGPAKLAPRETNAQTGTTYTLVLADDRKIITMSNASANTLTIPTNASVAFDVGAQIDIIQKGAGATTVTGDTGVTVNGVSAGGGAITAQYAAVTIVKDATDAWIMMGSHGVVS